MGDRFQGKVAVVTGGDSGIGLTTAKVTTPIFGRMDLTEKQLRQTKEWITSQVPLKRFGDPEEIAAAVLFLTSPESSFIVGTELVIDGGMIGL